MSMNRQGMRRSLRRRLMLSYLVIVALTVTGVALLAGQLTTRQFRSLIAQDGQVQAQGLALYFADYYRTHGSWDGVQEAMAQLDQAKWRPTRLSLEDVPFFPWRMPPPPWLGEKTIEQWVNLGEPQADQILLIGGDGLVLADNLGRQTGQRLPERDVARGAPISVGGARVGTVVVGAGIGRLTRQQRAFVQLVWRRLIGISLFAGIVALAVSYGLAREITKPVQALTHAARRLAAGHWDEKLSVQSEDELGQMTVAFNEMADELTRQTRLRRQMVADMAHELRTPLSVLQLELEALEDGLQSPAEATASLRGELRLLTQLVDDLRILAQTEAGELPLHLEPTDLAALIDETVARWQGRAAARGIQLTAQVAGDLPSVNIDRTRISQVLTNLLSNALRHAPKGGRISIQLSVISDQSSVASDQSSVISDQIDASDRLITDHCSLITDHCLLVTVRDTGEGIPSKDLPFIFERFYRVDRARRRDTGGAGLGLAIARQLVELHGGRIWAESEEGAGSTFAFVLPIHRATWASMRD
ncbi:MAG: sensor histidine kinase [Anaerolineae bacterium]